MADNESQTARERVARAYSLGYEYEQKHGGCSQCVLAAVRDVLGVVDDSTFKAAHGLAAGGGLSTQGTCGALAGGILAIGARYGRERSRFGDGHPLEPFMLGKQLHDRFVAEFDSPICAGVQTKLYGRTFNMWDPQDVTAFEEAGGHRDMCPRVVGSVAGWTVEMLQEAEEDA